MHHPDWKHVMTGVCAALAGCALLLWSWNTLATHLGAPAAGFRHLVALLIIMVLLRRLLTTRRRI